MSSPAVGRNSSDDWRSGSRRTLARGLGSLIAPGGRRGRLAVLMYHRVVSERDPIHDFGTPVATFEAQMTALADVFNVLPLSEAVERMHTGTLPPRAVAITFDDGYRDNADIACSILRRNGLTATFFISSAMLDDGIMFHDAVSEVIHRLPEDHIDLAWLGLGTLALNEPGARGLAIELISRAIKPVAPPQRLAITRRLADAARVALPTDLMMNDDHVRQLVASGMEIGGHTHDHPILTSISDAEVREQILINRRRLESITGQRLTLFAYPNGKPNQDYTTRHAAIVRECGYRAAFNTAYGSGGMDVDLMQIPRIAPWDMSTRAFVLRLMAFGQRTRNLLTSAA